MANAFAVWDSGCESVTITCIILSCLQLFFYYYFIILMNTDHILYDKVRLYRSRALNGAGLRDYYWSRGSQLKYREIYSPTRCCKMEKLC